METYTVHCTSTAGTIPQTIAPYIATQDLPDCIILHKGNDNKDQREYKQVECVACNSIILTRCAGAYANRTLKFWCPVCEAPSRHKYEVVTSFQPYVIKMPATGSA
jgi:hypothetical protein